MTMEAEARLDLFIDRYSPSVAGDGRKALAFLHDRLPTATRLVYDNYNALVVGFGPSDRVADIILSIAFYPRYVTLFFARGTEVPDPNGLLQGAGSRVRSVRLANVAILQSPQVEALIDAAVANSSLPKEGEGALVIKSISAKQRPRRPKL